MKTCWPSAQGRNAGKSSVRVAGFTRPYLLGRTEDGDSEGQGRGGAESAAIAGRRTQASTHRTQCGQGLWLTWHANGTITGLLLPPPLLLLLLPSALLPSLLPFPRCAALPPPLLLMLPPPCCCPAWPSSAGNSTSNA